jgi:hypothetical protein
MFTPMLCDYRRDSCDQGSAQSGHGGSKCWRDSATIAFILYEGLAHARRALGTRVANGG